MILNLSISLHTDCDFWVPDVDSVFNKHSVMYEGTKLIYKYSMENELIMFYLHITGDTTKCYHAARDLMEHLVCAFSVTPSHYYLVKDLYELIISVKDAALYKNQSGTWTNHLFGNYDGTEVVLNISDI